MEPRVIADAWFGMTPAQAELWTRGDPALKQFETPVMKRIWTYVRWTLPAKRGWPPPTDEEANDITQETRIVLMKSYRAAAGPLKPYAFTAAYHQSVNTFRRASRERDVLAGLEETWVAPDDDHLEEISPDYREGLRELREAIDSAAAALSTPLRETYDLWCELGDYKLVALALGVKKGTAAARWSRARTALRERLGAAGIRVVARGECPAGARIILMLENTLVIEMAGEDE